MRRLAALIAVSALLGAAIAEARDIKVIRGKSGTAGRDLIFGTAKPDGSAVTEEEFGLFLDQVITPLFPAGLTLVSALGQFLGSAGLIIQENSKLLILLYPAELRKANSVKIENIRNAYTESFQQESVLRSDRCCEEVGF